MSIQIYTVPLAPHLHLYPYDKLAVQEKH